MKTLWNTRLRWMLLGWGCVGLCYELSRRLQGPGTVLPETALDRLIPYDPSAVGWYLAFFLYIPWAYLTAEVGRLPWLCRAMQLCGVGSALVYLLWPTTVSIPALPPAPTPGSTEAWHLMWLRGLHAVDTPQNCLPSLHAALTLLSGWALWPSPQQPLWRRAVQAAAVLGAGLAITLAVVQLRRHVSIDVAAGLLSGILCGWLAKRSHPHSAIP